jgi:hypothetical protein
MKNKPDSYIVKAWNNALKAFLSNRYKPKHLKDSKPSIPNHPYDTQIIDQDLINTIPRKLMP